MECVSLSSGSSVVISETTDANTAFPDASGAATQSFLALPGSWNLYEIFDLITEPRADFAQSTKRPCTVATDDSFYALGGYDSLNGGATNYFQQYHIDSDSWTIKSPMNSVRYLHSCLVVNNIIFAFGGVDHAENINDPNSYSVSIEYLDLNSAEPEWHYSKSIILQARIASRVLHFGGTKIILMGGFGYVFGDIKGALDTTEMYDFVTDTVCHGPRTKQRRASFSPGIYYHNSTKYTCIQLSGGKTGIGSDLVNLPDVDSCDYICVDPTLFANETAIPTTTPTGNQYIKFVSYKNM